MLPPLDPSVLTDNTNFEVLYKDLCTRKLNPDCSTRDTKKQRMHDEIRKTLTTHRTTHLTTKLLTTLLSDLPSKSPTLPPDLHSTIELATAQMRGNVSAVDCEILSGDMNTFYANISTISSALSDQLTAAASLLCTIASPTSPPKIGALSSRAEALYTDATSTLPQELARRKVDLANATHALLTLHLDVLQTAIRILEQTQHGTLARATKTKAELLHARATVLDLQARIHTHTHPPPAPFVAALKNFRDGQGSSEARLKDREGLALRTLELYAKAGEKAMKDLARRKEVLLEETARIEGEIERLERSE